MNVDLPALCEVLSQPITGVQVALPKSLGGNWPWRSKVRTNFAAIRTHRASVLLHYGLVPGTLLDGLADDDAYEGCVTAGTLTLIEPNDMAAEQEALAVSRPFQTPEPLEMVDLDRLFRDAGRIYVEGATACEVSFTQIIRAGEFRFDVSGIRIFSAEASTLLERGSGGVLECVVQS
jgi:hypothetical protein